MRNLRRDTLGNDFAVFAVSHSVSRSSWVFAMGQVRGVVCESSAPYDNEFLCFLIVLSKLNTHCDVNA